MKKRKTQWRPAFCAALQLELAQDAEILDFLEAYPLPQKQLQIDILVIKKQDGIRLHKNIGHLFRRHNIVQYKSPEDYLSIRDFYEAYGYACFYQAADTGEEKREPSQITISFVCNHYPYKLVKHLTGMRKGRLRRYEDGIYHFTGEVFPMQLIVTHELSERKNYWLQKLRADLKSGGEIEELARRCLPYHTDRLHLTVLDTLLGANKDQAREEKEMGKALRELFAEELMEAEALGRAKGILDLLGRTGPVSPAVSARILEEGDEETLKKWLFTAANAGSQEEFEAALAIPEPPAPAPADRPPSK